MCATTGTDRWWWLYANVLLGPFLKALGRPKVIHPERLPRTGPVILASNHVAYLDSCYLPLMLERRTTFVTKREYFERRGPVGAVTRIFLTSLGQVPVDPSDGRAARAALDTLLRLLAEDHMVGIYPEGTRSRDGLLHKGRTGVARVALESGAVVVPAGIHGTTEINPRGKWLPRPGRVRIVLGEPLDFSSYGGATDARTLRLVTDEIMRAIAAVSGQEYVDTYSPSS